MAAKIKFLDCQSLKVETKPIWSCMLLRSIVTCNKVLISDQQAINQWCFVDAALLRCPLQTIMLCVIAKVRDNYEQVTNRKRHKFAGHSYMYKI